MENRVRFFSLHSEVKYLRILDVHSACNKIYIRHTCSVDHDLKMCSERFRKRTETSSSNVYIYICVIGVCCSRKYCKIKKNAFTYKRTCTTLFHYVTFVFILHVPYKFSTIHSLIQLVKHFTNEK